MMLGQSQDTWCDRGAGLVSFASVQGGAKVYWDLYWVPPVRESGELSGSADPISPIRLPAPTLPGHHTHAQILILEDMDEEVFYYWQDEVSGFAQVSPPQLVLPEKQLTVDPDQVEGYFACLQERRRQMEEDLHRNEWEAPLVPSHTHYPTPDDQVPLEWTVKAGFICPSFQPSSSVYAPKVDKTHGSRQPSSAYRRTSPWRSPALPMLVEKPERSLVFPKKGQKQSL